MRLFPLLAALALASLFLWWFMRTPPERVVRLLRKSLLLFGGALLVFLAATGRLPWVFAVLGAAVPFVQRAFRLLQFLPLLQRLWGTWRGPDSSGSSRGGQSSRVRTRFIDVSLEHDTGAMSGTVMDGRYQGRHLAELSLEQLLDLLGECAAADEQSAAVLEAYLDREHGVDWRTRGPGHEARREPPSGGAMTPEEAYEILGLPNGAEKGDILAAHRRLMQKLHPDRGGSTFLASQINKAKDRLLSEKT